MATVAGAVKPQKSDITNPQTEQVGILGTKFVRFLGVIGTFAVGTAVSGLLALSTKIHFLVRTLFAVPFVSLFFLLGISIYMYFTIDKTPETPNGYRERFKDLMNESFDYVTELVFQGFGMIWPHIYPKAVQNISEEKPVATTSSVRASDGTPSPRLSPKARPLFRNLAAETPRPRSAIADTPANENPQDFPPLDAAGSRAIGEGDPSSGENSPGDLEISSTRLSRLRNSAAGEDGVMTDGQGGVTPEIPALEGKHNDKNPESVCPTCSRETSPARTREESLEPRRSGGASQSPTRRLFPNQESAQRRRRRKERAQRRADRSRSKTASQTRDKSPQTSACSPARREHKNNEKRQQERKSSGNLVPVMFGTENELKTTQNQLRSSSRDPEKGNV
ncbi:MAG: hypothetical protein AAGI90_01640 [Chlamydiota bacterium]